MLPSRKAKLFWNGRSQAVRLPKEFRFKGPEVLIRKEGSSVILEPVERNWSEAFLRVVLGPPIEGFPEREQPLRDQERESL